jgi:hypothetical protein
VPHICTTTQELVRRHPAQDQRSRLCRVEARRHAGRSVSPERPIGGIRSDHRHIGHSVADLEVAHAIGELVDFPDHVIANHERWSAERRLRVQVAPDQHISVLYG